MSRKIMEHDVFRAGTDRSLTRSEYESLSDFRYLIRCFLDFSQKAAREVGLSPRQHQALLAIKGLEARQPVTIGELAERLLIRHHSAAELVNRLADADLVVRSPDSEDHRRVLLQLTSKAEQCLQSLSAAHLDELRRIGPILNQLLAVPETPG